MEELFLGRVLARDELNVVDHEDVNRTEHLFEVDHLAVFERGDEAIHELLSREIHHVHFGRTAADFMGNGVHQVGFTQTNATIEEQRVKGDRATFGNATGRSMSEFVRFADNEIVERIARIQRRIGNRRIDGRWGLVNRRSSNRRGTSAVGSGADIKRKAFNFGTIPIQVIDDLVSIILRDVVTKERGRRGELCHTFAHIYQFKWLDPVRKIPSPHAVF